MSEPLANHATDNDITTENAPSDEKVGSQAAEESVASRVEEEVGALPSASEEVGEGVSTNGPQQRTGAGSEDEVDGLVGEGTATGQQTPDIPRIAESTAQPEPEADESQDASISMNNDESTTSIPPAATSDSGMADPQSSLLDPIIRAATPSSRTSTPPLGSSVGYLAKKKFSSVNVNQKFLSKAGSPAPTTGATKIATLNGRPAAAPVPISSSSSRLLSTKLTTVPTSKSSTSPNPSGASPASAASSPWAKPALPPTTDSASPIGGASTLHHPAPTRARVLGMTTAPAIPIGAGQGIATLAPRAAWKAVPGDGRRAAVGFPRDFPTANEVAEGKKAAAMAAQAQAAHNQAILQGLNVFTHLEPGAHRWDEEDEDDDVMDFGDGSHPHHVETHMGGPPPIEPIHDLPVSKSERFAEDFDRSWPRKAPIVAERPPIFDRRSDSEGRVLFNASSNRLEPQAHRQQPNPQPTKLMSRPTEPSARDERPPPPAPAGRGFDRVLPPHLQGGADTGRMLPPHMANASSPAESRPLPGNTGPLAPPQRQAWGGQRVAERPLPPHLAERRDLPPQNAAPEVARPPPQVPTDMPSRQPLSQASAPAQPPIPSQAPDSTAGVPPVENGVDAQTAEMHTAAEKARLRRLAEEAEREAAAERARRKARELEERLHSISAGEPKQVEAPQIAPGIANAKPTPQITLATRPRPAAPVAEAPRGIPASFPAPTNPITPRPDATEIPQKAAARSNETSWRSRVQPAAEPSVLPPAAPAHLSPPSIQPTITGRSPRPTAEEFFDQPENVAETIRVQIPAGPDMPKHNFDDMLARIQAAMAEARTVPTLTPEVQELVEHLSETSIVPPSQPSVPQSNRSARAQEAPTPAPVPRSIHEFFDITYPDPPKSPPPVWRTYAVKAPKSQPPRPPISRFRQRSAEATPAQPPRDWLMTFNPALDGLNIMSLSLADLLLPQPVLRRFQRSTDVPPIVSISPRQFEPFEKKGKRKSAPRDTRPLEILIPVTPVENLLPSASSSSGLRSQQLRDQRARQEENNWRKDELLAETTQQPIETPAPQVSPPEPPRKTRSPVKASAGARAERDGRFNADGVTTDLPDRGRLPLSDKPGVRFMVSSELEGDSLLDEVNKMSLETLGEGEDKVERGSEAVAKLSGAETPKTPPSLSGVTRSSSPNSATTPWSKTPLSYPTSHSPARSTSHQHDHDAIKSVWDHVAANTALSSQQLNAAVSKQTHDNSAPVYPTLNAPSAADASAGQAAATGMKMGFPHSQFSSPGGVAPMPISNSFSMRQSPGYGQYSPQTLTSPEPTHTHTQAQMMGLAYSHTPRAASIGNVNGNGFQQGLWSSTSFGSSMASPGYGYSAQGKSAMPISGDKMGYAGNQKGDGVVYGAQVGVGGEYRYPHVASGAAYGHAHPQQQHQQQHQHQHQHQHHQAYAAAPGYGRGVANPQVYGYSYGSAPGSVGAGAAGNQIRPAGASSSGRFTQANGAVDYTGYAQDVSAAAAQAAQGQAQTQGGAGGYYGGLAQAQGGYPQSQGYAPHRGAGGSGGGGGGGGPTRKMW